jgi:predicted kinase
MIDPHGSSLWRREASFMGSLAIAERLLQYGRSVVTETHSRWPEQTDRFRTLAANLTGVIFRSFLIVAPYDVCVQRAAQRHVPDIDYLIEENMIAAYHTNLEPLSDEIVIDSTLHSPSQAAQAIVARIGNSNFDIKGE